MKDYKTVKKGEYVYAYVPDHPYCTKNGYILEHRYIIEQHLGRLLSPNEVVHHKDGNKKNNNIDNLEIMSNSEHSKFHNRGKGRKFCLLKCPWCGELFKLPYNHSFLQKKNKLHCNCCSNECRGKLSSNIQHHGLSKTLEAAISENLVSIYIKYLDDNSEVTDAAGTVETIRS